MIKRNTRVDDAGLSEAEAAKLNAILAADSKRKRPSELMEHGIGTAAEVAPTESRTRLAQPNPKKPAKRQPSRLTPEALKAQEEVERIDARIAKLQSRLFRTTNALATQVKRRRYWQKKAAAA